MEDRKVVLKTKALVDKDQGWQYSRSGYEKGCLRLHGRALCTELYELRILYEPLPARLGQDLRVYHAVGFLALKEINGGLGG